MPERLQNNYIRIKTSERLESDSLSHSEPFAERRIINMDFTKMHGLGNDFIIINEEAVPSIIEYSKLARILCNRNTGIGADGIIIAAKSRQAALKMLIYNSDGSQAEMCGNGVRCLAHYAYGHQLVNQMSFKIETLSGIVIPCIKKYDKNRAIVEINMGVAQFQIADILTNGENSLKNHPIKIGKKAYTISTVIMGVPHTVLKVDELSEEEVGNIGPLLEKDALFRHGTNVNFVKVIQKEEINVRTWERGAGKTLACGTGACASVVALANAGILERTVNVHLLLGDLQISWLDSGDVLMRGPSEHVFEGSVELPGERKLS